jgi:DNA-binding XRE family transcriptional regulator
MILAQLRKQKKISKSELAIAVGIKEKIMVMIEDYRVLPTPDTMIKIETALNADRLQIYSRDEIRLLRKKNGKKNIPDDYPYFHIHVRLDRKFKDLFSKAALKEAGYKSLNDWFMRRAYDLIKRIEYVTEAKKEKDPAYLPPEEIRVLFDNPFIVKNRISKKLLIVNGKENRKCQEE